MKYVNITLCGVTILVIIMFAVANATLHQAVQELIEQNKKLEEVTSEISRKYNYCGWYEDFYYEHAKEFGAFE